MYSFYSIDRYLNSGLIIKYVFATITSKCIFVPQVSLSSKNRFYHNMSSTQICIYITAKTISSSMLNFSTEFINDLEQHQMFYLQETDIPRALFGCEELQGEKKPNHHCNDLTDFLPEESNDIDPEPLPLAVDDVLYTVQY